MYNCIGSEICSQLPAIKIKCSFTLRSDIFCELQLAIVTEERDKLKNVANLKKEEAGDGSTSANLVQVAIPGPPCPIV